MRRSVSSGFHLRYFLLQIRDSKFGALLKIGFMRRDSGTFLATSALFVGSGCAAFIYEIVWFQLLSLVIGASGVSLAILLASFMGGMCLGSLAYSRFVSAARHPLRVYATLEILIAVCGLAILVGLPAVSRLYWAFAGHGIGGMFLRAVVAAAILLPPTVLMGATLPAMARSVEATRIGIARLGFFYGANTFGAVAGSLLSGFYLLRVHDVVVTTGFAVGLNLAVAVLALLLARKTPHVETIQVEVQHSASVTTPAWAIYLGIGLSGLTAIGGEVIWTRLLSLIFGPTVYTFSIILAVFLAGIGFGSAVGASISRFIRYHALALAVCQALLVAAIAFSAFMVVDIIPHWSADPRLVHGIWQRMSIDLGRAAAALLPAACLWGASFPLAVGAAVSAGRDSAQIVGRVYAANTLGGIAGALLASLAGIPVFGTRWAQLGLTVLAGLSAFIVLRSTENIGIPSPGAGTESLTDRRHRWVPVAVVGLLVAAGGLFAARFTPAVPAGLMAYGRYVDLWQDSPEYYYVAQGIDADVVVSLSSDGLRCFHVSGKVEASDKMLDLRTERVLGHLPALIHSQPRKALVICCGAGVTAGSLTVHPTIERIVICEIEARVPEAAGRYFARENQGVLTDPKTQVFIDDGRNFLASTDETFDLITTDPIHPWVRGSASLYTVEFFEMCKAHLNPGGVVALWVPLYESNEAAVKCELATFVNVFPDATVWGSNLDGGGYDLTLVGTIDQMVIDPARFARQVAAAPALRQSLADVEFWGGTAVMRAFVGYGSELANWLRGTELNRDRNLRLQYLAGLSPENYTEHDIFLSLAASRRTQLGASEPQPE